MNAAAISTARDFISRTYPGIQLPQCSYLVLMSARSGSMLLCAQLEKAGFGRPVEAFNSNKNPMFHNVWDIDYSNDHDYLKTAIDYQTVNGVLGMKFSLNQFHLFQQVAGRLLAPANIPLSDAETVEVFFPGVRYIHLQRRDKVKQAVSYAKAWQNGIWYENADGGDDFKEYLLPALYDREHIACCLDIILAIDLGWQRYLRENQLDSLEIWYEDLAADFAGKMREVYDFLGIKDAIIEAAPLRKQANTQSQEWEQRFRAETPWLSEPANAAALASGDLASLPGEHELAAATARGVARWQVMPATRYKALRSLAFRVKRKLDSLLKK